jgi:Protein of unknown function (DUF 659)
LRIIDTSGMTKDAQYIADAVLSGIDKVGHENSLLPVQTFLRIIDTSGMTKDAQYIADAVLSGIDKVGHENALQVITDNAANFKGARPIITTKYKRIMCSPCAAHTHLICWWKTGAKYRG